MPNDEPLSRPRATSRTRRAFQPIVRLARLARRPLERFLRIQAASGIVLLVAAAIALAWASSPWARGYFALLHAPIELRLGGLAFSRPVEWFVNDGLMVIFFFVVGMEIRREIHAGELSTLRRAALPAAAALGGMVVPAAIYVIAAGGAATRHGWGVPMATDIAFAVGILTLLGRRVPPALRVLLLALAVIDDLGAIIVIALFYSGALVPSGFLVAALGFLAIVVLRRFGVRKKLAYVPPAVVAWWGVYVAGVHPTIAGVLVGLLTPVERVRGEPSPCESLIDTLHPWVAFGIMPVFALTNAGVSLAGGTAAPAADVVKIGVAVGLALGKPLGIWGAVAASVRLGIGLLPRGIGPRHIGVLGLVAGVGFTMSLFIAALAFDDPALLAGAKVGVLAGSALAAVLALGVGRAALPTLVDPGAATSADEAEKSTEK